MTVTRRPTQKFATPNSNVPSDTESFDLASVPSSDTESITNDPVHPVQLNALDRYYFPSLDNLRLRKSAGRRKQRRYRNDGMLKALLEEDENDPLDINVMQSQHTPLRQLMENSSALAFWHNFITLPEEEQDRIIGNAREQVEVNNASSQHKLFKQIAIKVRKILKRRDLPLAHLIAMENDLIGFFDISPQAVYSKSAKNHLEVFLFQSIAHFHTFDFSSVRAEGGLLVQISSTTYVQPQNKFYNLVETKSFSRYPTETETAFHGVINTLSSLTFVM